MDNRYGRQGRLRVAEAVSPDPAHLADLVPIIRTSFAAGDLLPGLPAADGASDTVESILADLEGGVRLWVAHADGYPVGCVRAIPRSDSIWQIRRLAVSIPAQELGIGRMLVRELEAAARAEGMSRLVVWALVERGIAPFYARLGYRTTGHFGSPDKLLSEAIMEVDLDGPRPLLSYPWGSEPRTIFPGMLISWFAGENRTVAVVGDLAGDVRAVIAEQSELACRLAGTVRFVGGDGWSDCSPAGKAALHAQMARRADAAEGPALLFRRTCTAVVEFTMPRAVEPRLLALWRMPLPPELRCVQPAGSAPGG